MAATFQRNELPAGVAVVSSPASPVPKGALTQEVLSSVEKAFSQATVAVCKAGDSWVPWKASKNKKCSLQAQSELSRVQPFVVEVVKVQQERATKSEAEKVALQVELDTLKGENARLLDTIDSLRSAVDGLQDEKDTKNGNMSALLKRVDNATSGPKRYLKVEDAKTAELLQGKVDMMIKELDKLRTENDKLSHTRAELNKRIKELQDKARDDAEVHEREARKVNADIKKAHDDREAAVVAAKAEAAEQLAVRAREIKALQKRLDTQKAEMETLKGREHTSKQQADERNSAAAKASQTARDAVRKANDAKCEKEELAAQLAVTKEEMSMLQAEYALVCKAYKKDQGGVIGQGGVKAEGPWPRQAFTARGGCVLHVSGCTKAADVTRMEGHEYRNAAELEGWLADGKMVLCTACKATGF